MYTENYEKEDQRFTIYRKSSSSKPNTTLLLPVLMRQAS